MAMYERCDDKTHSLQHFANHEVAGNRQHAHAVTREMAYHLQSISVTTVIKIVARCGDGTAKLSSEAYNLSQTCRVSPAPLEEDL
jgi:hypothetical protein